MKPKHCRVCKAEFQPFNSLHKACSPKCALELAVSVREKKERKERREAKVKLKSRSDHLRDAQTIFNRYIRLRDAKEPCISCGRHHEGQYHAGHYRTVGACPELRFDEDNCHKQCAPCNNHLSGNIVEYRINLLNKLGQARLDKLEGPHEPKKYTIEEIQRIKATYKAGIKALEA